MKYVLILTAALLVSACSTKHKKDGDACCGGAKEASAHGPANAATTAEAAAVTTAAASEEISKIYSAQKAKLGKTCAPAASAHCGKVTRDLNITEGELSCLWGKVFRTTKEAIPDLDGSACAKLIKSAAASPAKVR